MTNEEFLKSISLEGEIWKDVVGYEGSYLISSHGRVVSFFVSKTITRHIQKVLKQRVNKLYRYPTVVLKDCDGNYHSHFVHRLVAEAFIPNPDNKSYIDHIDTNNSNNRVENLRWCTQSENLRNPITRSRRIGVKRNMIAHNRRAVVQFQNGVALRTFDCIEDTRVNGFTPNCVCRCCTGEISHHKGFQWKYLSDCPNLNISDVKEL